MKWHKVKGELKKIFNGDHKGIEYLYVISQWEDKKPYKIGITKSDILRRMGNFQTAFIDFDIYYLVALPNKQAQPLENKIHNDPTLKRIPFPKKRRGQKQIFSEWVQSSLVMIKKALDKYALESDTIKPIYAYDLTGNTIQVMDGFARDLGDPTFGQKPSKRSGRIQTLSKKGSDQYNAIKFDNNRVYEGIDFSMAKNERRPTQYTNM